MNNTIKKLQAIMAIENIKENEPMKNHTSFQVGGPADLFLMPQTQTELQQILKICKESDKPFYIMGNGSNLIVRDKGYRGIIINTKALNQVEIIGTTLIAEPGSALKIWPILR